MRAIKEGTYIGIDKGSGEMRYELWLNSRQAVTMSREEVEQLKTVLEKLLGKK